MQAQRERPVSRTAREIGEAQAVRFGERRSYFSDAA
jgi:hypothetical protein